MASQPLKSGANWVPLLARTPGLSGKVWDKKNWAKNLLSLVNSRRLELSSASPSHLEATLHRDQLWSKQAWGGMLGLGTVGWSVFEKDESCMLCMLPPHATRGLHVLADRGIGLL